MKLILVPSNPNHGPRVAVSVPQDGGDIDAFLETVVAPALVAYGWSPQLVQEAMHRIEVPGATEEPETSDRPPSRQHNDEYPIAPAPPEGFTIVGRSIEGPDPDSPMSIEDLRYFSEGAWRRTSYADGGGYWYAARTGSETLAELQAHLAAR